MTNERVAQRLELSPALMREFKKPRVGLTRGFFRGSSM